MSNVTELTPRTRRLDNPATQQGRVYIVMRDADTWLQLHEIATEMRRRFNVLDSEAAISARLRDLRNLHGQTVAHKRRDGSKADEYWMPNPWNDGGTAA